MESASQIIERIEGDLKTLKEMMGRKVPKTQVVRTQKVRISLADSLPADQLGPAPDFQDPNWPRAADPRSIISPNSDDDEKNFRALQILNLLNSPLEGKTVLDCGCGDGHVALAMAERAKKVVGYDLTVGDNLLDTTVFFTNQKTVAERGGPYDLILLYDVLDHLQGTDPVSFLGWLASLLAGGGQIFVRTHPWTARHGSHLYESEPRDEHGISLGNRAFLHLTLTPDELAQAGLGLPPVLRLNKPMASYDHIFKETGLKTQHRKGSAEKVEDYFHGDLLDRIIKVTWKGTIDHATALRIMSNSFIDYHLSK